MKRGYLVLAFLIFAIPLQLIAQDLPQATTATPEAAFYKWEAGIDLLPLIDKSRDAFGFIVKRNFQTADLTKRSALRLKLRPQFQKNLGQQQSSIYLAVGYEKQKMFGHFSVLYGAEPFVQYNRSRTDLVAINRTISKQTDTIIGVGGFVGGRYYIGRHLAATLESHLIYQHTSLKGFLNGGSDFSSQSDQLFFEPIHAIYLSYHF